MNWCCKYCEESMHKEICEKHVSAGHGRVFVCTRGKGHGGPCVACGLAVHDITGAVTEKTDDNESR